MSTQVKYHINPATGDPRRCNAVKRACKYAKAGEPHFETEVAARAFYEMKMRDQELAEAKDRQEKLILAEYQKHFPDELETWDETAQGATKDIQSLSEYAPRLAPHRDTWLTQEQTAEINVDGVNCPHCGQQATPGQAAYILNEMNTAVCKKCDGDFDLYTMSIRVGKTKDTYAAFDAAEVSKMVWYHSTNSEDWDGSLEENGGFVAHLGSVQAAYDRRIAEDYNDKIRKDGFWLFEVSVAPTAKIAETVDPDDNADFDNSDRMKGSDVVRYINKWEDMASISLAANTKSLKVRSKRFVSPTEVMKSPSLYNVDLTKVEE